MRVTALVRGHSVREVFSGHRVARIAVVCIAVIVLLMPAACLASTDSATMRSLSLGMAFLVGGNEISVGEPLVARVDVRNHSSETVRFTLSRGGGWTTRISILDDRGNPVATTPAPNFRAGGLAGVAKIEPGAVFSRVAILSCLYNFDKPGVYTVLVQQLCEDEANPVVSEVLAKLRVLPKDTARVEAQCRKIFGPLQDGSVAKSGLTVSQSVFALCSVRDDAVIANLDWLVRRWDSSEAAKALRRIDSARGRAAVDALRGEAAVGPEAKKALRPETPVSGSLASWIWG